MHSLSTRVQAVVVLSAIALAVGVGLLIWQVALPPVEDDADSNGENESGASTISFGGPTCQLLAQQIAIPDFYPPRVTIAKNATFSMLAWGHENGGTDSNTGKVVFVDYDAVSDIATHHANGKTVVCYVSTGTWEGFRSDAADIGWTAIKLNKMDDWDGEWWLDIVNLAGIDPMMNARFDIAKANGCDAIEGDNVDCYDNSDCKDSLTLAPGKTEKYYQYEYNCFQVNATLSRGMGIGLKNALAIASDLAPYYDFAVNEQCQQWNECSEYNDSFLKANKAVFSHEYVSASTVSTACDAGGLCSKRAGTELTGRAQQKYCEMTASGGGLCAVAWQNCWECP